MRKVLLVFLCMFALGFAVTPPGFVITVVLVVLHFMGKLESLEKKFKNYFFEPKVTRDLITDLIEECNKLGDDTKAKLELISHCDYSRIRRKANVLSQMDGLYKSELKMIRELYDLCLLNENDVKFLEDIVYKKREEGQENFREYMEQELGSNPKKKYKENKKKGIVSCPKCGSTSITTTNKKVSVTRGAVGGAVLGSIGAGVGAVTSKKIYNVCMNCGHKWKP